MKIATILFMIEQPFTSRNYQRFGIDCLLKNGFKVEVWNVTDITTPGAVSDHDQYRADRCLLRTFSDRRGFLGALSTLDRSCFVVNLVGYRPEALFFYRALSRTVVDYALVSATALPAQAGGEQCRASLVKILKKLSIERLVFHVTNRLPAIVSRLRPAEMILASGEKSLGFSALRGAGTEVLWIHTLDYDRYLEERADVPADATETCVFLDEYYPFHPDYAAMGIDPPVTAEEYYPSLCRVFARIENELGLRVVVAAHPRSQYDRHPDYFEGRPVVRDRTVELVRDSRLVLLHCSTAVNYSVLFRKPMLFMTSEKIDKSMYGPYVHAMAESFGKRPLSLDAAIPSLDEVMDVPEEPYAAYQRSFIKRPGTPELPFWQVFADRVKAYR